LQTYTTIETITWLVLLLPLLSFAVCGLVSERYAWLASVFGPVILLITATLGVYLFILSPRDSSILIPLHWFTVGEYSFTFNLELNSLSILMVPVVTVISFLVHMYSAGYMVGDIGFRRYFAMLGFFTFSMLGIVLANDLLMIFVFWELVGFSSYMLIGHWLEKPKAAKAAQKAFLFNRIGDVGFLIGLMIIWSNTHTFNLNDLLYHFEIYSWQTAASLCIFCGVIGKSAQLPLFTWLPDAMEGPTPVSALIHAATMVAAGVFLLARIFMLFTPVALNVVAIVGIITALMAAMSALNQYDIKKILAYSTISQLGLMVTAVGAGAEKAAMLHLFTHAFFKAGLFLAAGSVIHVLHQAQHKSHQHFDVQDIRNLGGLRNQLPITFFTFVITGSSLAGIPFFSGFLSKDSILTSIYNWSNGELSWQFVILIAAFAVSFLTVLYTFRMIWFIFFGKQQYEISISESPWIMRAPLIFLSACSGWFILSLNPFYSTGWFTSLIGNLNHSTSISIISAVWVLLALATAWFMYSRKSSATIQSEFLQNGLGLDTLFFNLFGKTTLKLATVTDTTDRKWIDGLLHFTAYAHVAVSHAIAWLDKVVVDGSVNTLAKLAGLIGSFTRSFQGGKIQLYIFWSIMALIIFLFFALI